jgi:predicted nucleic acid-binding Zn ribbon protein
VNDIWLKYWYVCTKCDASIEIVSKVKPMATPSCSCGTAKKRIVLCQISADIH